MSESQGLQQVSRVSNTTNGMAVASLTCGLFWVFGVSSIAALILGYKARSQIRARGQNGDGLAIAGIVLGWIGLLGLVVVLILIAVLAAAATNGPTTSMG